MINMVRGNRNLAGFSRCETCRNGADGGDVDEQRLCIAGQGRWDD